MRVPIIKRADEAPELTIHPEGRFTAKFVRWLNLRQGHRGDFYRCAEFTVNETGRVVVVPFVGGWATLKTLEIMTWPETVDLRVRRKENPLDGNQYAQVDIIFHAGEEEL